MKLAGPLALLKLDTTRNLEYIAREGNLNLKKASQIFGGNSYLREGIGANVERVYRDVRVNAIGGGSEEILLDLAMRMAKL